MPRMRCRAPEEAPRRVSTRKMKSNSGQTVKATVVVAKRVTESAKKARGHLKKVIEPEKKRKGRSKEMVPRKLQVAAKNHGKVGRPKGVMKTTSRVVNRTHLKGYARRMALRSIRKLRSRAAPEERREHAQLLKELSEREERFEGEERSDGHKLEDVPNRDSKNVGDEYEAEKVLDSHYHKGRLEYYVLWKSYSLEDCTWEPAENLDKAAELIEEHYKRVPKAPGAPGVTPKGRGVTKK